MNYSQPRPWSLPDAQNSSKARSEHNPGTHPCGTAKDSLSHSLACRCLITDRIAFYWGSASLSALVSALIRTQSIAAFSEVKTKAIHGSPKARGKAIISAATIA